MIGKEIFNVKKIKELIEISKDKVKERHFSVIEKISISLLLSFFWVIILALITPNVRYTPFTLPVFGYLYSKIFNLINT